MIQANHKSEPTQLISPEEVIGIMDKAASLEDMRRAAAIAEEYIKRNGAPAMSKEWHLMYMLADIYQAGRIQGIREQKARQAMKTTGHA